MPEVRIGTAVAGRQTLAAITEELAAQPLSARLEGEESSPDVVVRETFAERDTLAAILAEASEPPAPAERTPASGVATSVEVFELLTFVVRGFEAARLTTEALRRRFVEEHLLARLPVPSMAAVERVDVTPWTVQGTLVVRVWCRATSAR
jgi:hypothetical protein